MQRQDVDISIYLSLSEEQEFISSKARYEMVYEGVKDIEKYNLTSDIRLPDLTSQYSRHIL